jgi:hypothetical protein
MTLILTEISHLGIAMATDSAVTFTVDVSGASWAVPSAAKKLQIIPSLNAGISCWGLGQVGTTKTDVWLADFIRRHDRSASIETLARSLASELNSMLGPNSDGKPTAGFHVAGFLHDDLGEAASLFHVHDGPSTALAAQGITIDPHVFNANHDIPPARTRAAVSQGQTIILRNGDYHLYAQLFQKLEELFTSLRPLGISIPHSRHLLDRVEYLVFQIRTVAEIYRQSNLVDSIGGAIPFLAISQAGIHTHGVRFA